MVKVGGVTTVAMAGRETGAEGKVVLLGFVEDSVWGPPFTVLLSSTLRTQPLGWTKSTESSTKPSKTTLPSAPVSLPGIATAVTPLTFATYLIRS